MCQRSVCCILQGGQPQRSPQGMRILILLPQGCIAAASRLGSWIGLGPERLKSGQPRGQLRQSPQKADLPRGLPPHLSVPTPSCSQYLKRKRRTKVNWREVWKRGLGQSSGDTLLYHYPPHFLFSFPSSFSHSGSGGREEEYWRLGLAHCQKVLVPLQILESLGLALHKTQYVIIVVM